MSLFEDNTKVKPMLVSFLVSGISLGIGIPMSNYGESLTNKKAEAVINLFNAKFAP